MRLYAIQSKTNRLEVEYPSSPTRSRMKKFYGHLDYVVVSEEQKEKLPRGDFDLICEVKKPAKKKAATAKTKEEKPKEA